MAPSASRSFPISIDFMRQCWLSLERQSLSPWKTKELHLNTTSCFRPLDFHIKMGRNLMVFSRPRPSLLSTLKQLSFHHDRLSTESAWLQTLHRSACRSLAVIFPHSQTKPSTWTKLERLVPRRQSRPWFYNRRTSELEVLMKGQTDHWQLASKANQLPCRISYLGLSTVLTPELVIKTWQFKVVHNFVDAQQVGYCGSLLAVGGDVGQWFRGQGIVQFQLSQIEDAQLWENGPSQLKNCGRASDSKTGTKLEDRTALWPKMGCDRYQSSVRNLEGSSSQCLSDAALRSLSVSRTH